MRGGRAGRRSHGGRRRRGFTLTEMMVVVACAACLAAIGLGVYGSAVHETRRGLCAVKLRRLHTILSAYAETNAGYLPDVGAASPMQGAVALGGFHFADAWDSRGTAFWPAERTTGNAGNLYLLIRLQMASPEDFVCPASGDRPAMGPFVDGRFSFLAFRPGSLTLTAAEEEFLRLNSTRHCSYSYQNMLGRHDGPEDGLVDPLAAAVHVDRSPGELAILADHNPYTQLQGEARECVDAKENPLANSLNHAGEGQNVLYLDGRVEWHTTPECGARLEDGSQDNIYRPAAGEVTDRYNVPRHVRDSYLVP